MASVNVELTVDAIEDRSSVDLSHVLNAELSVLKLFAPTLFIPVVCFFCRIQRRIAKSSTTVHRGTGFQCTRLEDLPKQPTPKYRRICIEQVLGAAFITSLVLLFMGIIEAVVSHPGTDCRITAATRSWFRVFAWTEAFVACACLLALQHRMCAGVVSRSQDACFPLPRILAERLRAEDVDETTGGLPGAWERALRDMGNQKHDQQRPGMEYCVRCMLWRDAGVHHCSKCQVCVPEFDSQGTGLFVWAQGHHCLVTGCYIYGRGLFRHNMWLFKLIIVGGLLAGASTALFAALLWMSDDVFEILVLAASMVMGFVGVAFAVRWAESQA